MIVTSGNVVHNLCALRWDEPDLEFDWARRFDYAVADMLFREPGDMLMLQEYPDVLAAVPATDHFVPLLYAAGRRDEAASRSTDWLFRRHDHCKQSIEI